MPYEERFGMPVRLKIKLIALGILVISLLEGYKVTSLDSLLTTLSNSLSLPLTGIAQ